MAKKQRRKTYSHENYNKIIFVGVSIAVLAFLVLIVRNTTLKKSEPRAYSKTYQYIDPYTQCRNLFNNLYGQPISQVHYHVQAGFGVCPGSTVRFGPMQTFYTDPNKTGQWGYCCADYTEFKNKIEAYCQNGLPTNLIFNGKEYQLAFVDVKCQSSCNLNTQTPVFDKYNSANKLVCPYAKYTGTFKKQYVGTDGICCWGPKPGY